MATVDVVYHGGCSELNAAGEPCKARRMKNGPSCFLHSMTDDARRAWRASGGRARQEAQRDGARLRNSSGHRYSMPGPLLAKVSAVVAALLDSVLVDGSGEPNMQDRSYGVLCLAALFGLKDDQREEILALLERVRPELARDTHVDRLLRLRDARAALVLAVEQGRLSPLDLPPELTARVDHTATSSPSADAPARIAGT